MASYQYLVRLLQSSPQRLNANGELNLTFVEAQKLRSDGFTTARPGPWKTPPLPQPIHTPASPKPAIAAAEPLQGRYSSRSAASLLAERVRDWLRFRATSNEKRVLAPIARQAAGITKRRLQQNLHRLPAAQLNHALAMLVDCRLVERAGALLTVPPAIRDALIEGGDFGVSRPSGARAWRADIRRQQTTRAHRRELPRGPTRPPRDTSAWGRWMLAKRGGYARQRQCRALRINPFAEANRRRLELQRLRRAYGR